ncbi:ClpX C4-type zinc finger protein [Archangium sp.]|jgi:hypothetical protein|uniref:ClpX C4-type zinc finger protein n=1 Tax=Archangium sp. TaxID=1872627 RepID=UPI002ED8CA66
MAENVRDVIRAAQAAELGGDKPRAIELLRRAAAMYRRAGGFSRAEQLLRYALRLDPSLTQELEEEIRRLSEVTQATSDVRAWAGDESSPDTSSPAPDEDPESGVWVIQEDTSAGALQKALREAELAVGVRTDPVAVAVEVVRSAVRSAEAAEVPSVPPPAPVTARVEEPSREPPEEPQTAFVERGPTRADPSLEAWCSFCCRPRSEVGPLVAGPAGAFICSACTGESSTLLGGVAPRAPSPRNRTAAARGPVPFELVGQEAAREQLERAWESGVRHVLVLGPEGSGKSTWMRALAEQGRGVLAVPTALDLAPLESTLLVEDVDRLPPAEQLVLGAFLARHPERTVLMTARGTPVASGVVLLSDSGRLPVLTTAALSEAVRGALPITLLERVQLLVPLEQPSIEDLVEMARRGLASREDCHLFDEVLVALATEASRSPRAGHELRALLARVPPGTWRLEAKKGKPKPARRGRRKGKS